MSKLCLGDTSWGYGSQGVRSYILLWREILPFVVERQDQKTPLREMLAIRVKESCREAP
jgi:hypothetical protein